MVVAQNYSCFGFGGYEGDHVGKYLPLGICKLRVQGLEGDSDRVLPGLTKITYTKGCVISPFLLLGVVLAPCAVGLLVRLCEIGTSCLSLVPTLARCEPLNLRTQPCLDDICSDLGISARLQVQVAWSCHGVPKLRKL